MPYSQKKIIWNNIDLLSILHWIVIIEWQSLQTVLSELVTGF